jgi:hypothetical protein
MSINHRCETAFVFVISSGDELEGLAANVFIGWIFLSAYGKK